MYGICIEGFYVLGVFLGFGDEVVNEIKFRFLNFIILMGIDSKLMNNK